MKRAFSSVKRLTVVAHQSSPSLNARYDLFSAGDFTGRLSKSKRPFYATEDGKGSVKKLFAGIPMANGGSGASYSVVATAFWEPFCLPTGVTWV